MGLVAIAEERGGKRDKNLDVKRPDWEVGAIGPKIYQVAVVIMREIGHYSMGRKINRRGTADGECGSTTGNENEEWETAHINDRFLAISVGILSRVFVSPFGVFGGPQWR